MTGFYAISPLGIRRMQRVFALALLSSVCWQPIAHAQGFDVTGDDTHLSGEPTPITSSLRLPTPSRNLPAFSTTQSGSSAISRDYSRRGLPPLAPVISPTPLMGEPPAATTPPPAPMGSMASPQTIAMPSKPLYPSRVNSQPTLSAPAASTPAPAPLPPAQQALPPVQMAESVPAASPSLALPKLTPVVGSPPAKSGIATLPPPPAPLALPARSDAASTTANAATPLPAPTPTGIAVGAPPEVLGNSAIPTAPMAAPAQLSPESKQILSGIQPAKPAPAARQAKLDVKRVNPEVADIIKNAEQHYESAGVSIKINNPRLDPVSELERAYNALMGGESEVAVRIYKDILQAEPTNEDALFGLAATYHRTGQLDNARPLYGRLLKQNPGHKEALNNFLMLVSAEAPQEALNELSTLEQRYPGFSPIPAQMAILFERLGQPEIARSKILRAIELSPENWVYKYNLAIMLDRQKQYVAAAEIYRELIQASLQGEVLPMDMHALQARYNYISAKTS